MNRTKRGVFIVLSLTILLLAAGYGNRQKAMPEVPLSEIAVKDFSAGASVHDPSIILGEDGKYYIFGSHMEAAVSGDLHKWNTIASGVNGKNPLFSSLFEPDYQAFSFVGKNEEGGYSVWAPDVIYNETMGKYMLYFCTTSSYIKSNLCFALSDQLTGPYEYVDTIMYSGFTKGIIDQTNFYDVMPADADISPYFLRPSQFNNLQWPNCIDPALFFDDEERLWMVYGSWSGGIFLLEIDKETGYPIHPASSPDNDTDAYYGKRLAGGMHNSIEGPYVLHEKENGYYYLFVSYGSLTSEGGYQIRLFRSQSPEGPYTDAAGEQLGGVNDHSPYGVKLMGNYMLPSNPKAYMAPGHCSAFTDKDGKMYVVYHTRFDDGSEYHEPRVHQLFLTDNGWLAAAPFATSGEALSEQGFCTADMAGTWHLLNHNLAIDSSINTSQPVSVDRKGNASGQDIHLTVQENTNYVTVTIDGIDYHGVIIDMRDEAGNDTRCITAIGDNNQAIWMVHYKSAAS